MRTDKSLREEQNIVKYVFLLLGALEHWFNLVWAVHSCLTLIGGVKLRSLRRTDRQVSAMTLAGVLFCVVAFLFPVISISDDLSYFEYWLGSRANGDGLLARASFSRRDQALSVGSGSGDVIALVSVSALALLFRSFIFGTVAEAELVLHQHRAPRTLDGRAPPCVLA
jgi:hypothetical protein